MITNKLLSFTILYSLFVVELHSSVEHIALALGSSIERYYFNNTENKGRERKSGSKTLVNFDMIVQVGPCSQPKGEDDEKNRFGTCVRKHRSLKKIK